MKRFLVLLAALVVSVMLTLTSETSAKGSQKPGAKRPGGQKPGGQRPGGQQPGGQRPGGQRPAGQRSSSAFRSRNYRGWTHYCWFANYGCYGYYSPDDRTWYYWYGPDDGYRPVTEMTNYPPDNSTPPSLPSGATRVQ